jgi:hypothetical protein
MPRDAEANVAPGALGSTFLTSIVGAWTIPEILAIYPAHEMCGLSSLPLARR